MAVLKWSALMTAAKGKLRGSVLQFGAGGQVVRANRQSNQFSNAAWSVSKVNNGTNANAWRSLTPTEVLSFTSQKLNYPTVDRYGNVRYPSDYELYMRLNNSLLFQTTTNILTCTPPVTFTNIYPFAPFSSGAGSLSILLHAAVSMDELLIVSATSPLSTGRSVPRGRYVQIYQASSGSGTSFSIAGAYIAKYGQIPSGQQIFVQLKIMNVTNGQYSVPAVAGIIIP